MITQDELKVIAQTVRVQIWNAEVDLHELSHPEVSSRERIEPQPDLTAVELEIAQPPVRTQPVSCPDGVGVEPSCDLRQRRIERPLKDESEIRDFGTEGHESDAIAPKFVDAELTVGDTHVEQWMVLGALIDDATSLMAPLHEIARLFGRLIGRRATVPTRG